MSTIPSLLMIELLADRKRHLGALHVQAIPSGAEAGHEELSCSHALLSALAAVVPCLFEARCFSSLQHDELLAAHCHPFVDSAVRAADEIFPATLPPDIEWVSGGWYMSPPEKSSDAQSVSRALALKLMQRVAADADTHELEDIFRQDPTLSYHLLRLVNSPGIGNGRKITSFAQAIILLGRQQLRRWINLMLFASRNKDPRAPMLMARAAVRARSMELLARDAGLDRQGQDRAFMVGMFSLLGVLFGQSLEDIMRPLQMGEAIDAAVLRQEGDCGELLALMTAAEQGNLSVLTPLLAHSGISNEDFNQVLIESHLWMVGVVLQNSGGEGV